MLPVVIKPMFLQARGLRSTGIDSYVIAQQIDLINSDLKLMCLMYFHFLLVLLYLPNCIYYGEGEKR